MRALAEFIVRGRLQAGTMAVLGYIIPLLTPVTVALVTLRKGANEGTVVLLFGLFPALLSLVFSDGSSAVIWVTLLSLIVVYVPAVVLRLTVSMPAMVMGSLLTAVLLTLMIMSFSAEYVDRLIVSLSERIVLSQEALSQQGTAAASNTVNANMFSREGIAGLVVYMLAFNGLIGVLLGRWLQAVAFNPGGFGREFREFRLGLPLSFMCFTGSLLLRFQGEGYLWWSHVFALPLVIVAISIAHSLAKARKIGSPWLVLFYIASIIFMPLTVCIGFVDTWVNFRDRFSKSDGRPS